MKTLTAGIGRFFLNAALPPTCPACAAVVRAQGTLCSTCFKAITFIRGAACDGCGLPMAAGTGVQRCAVCSARPPPWSSGRAAMLYDEKSRGLILGLKHADRQENVQFLALQMVRAAHAMLTRAELLVPVPLHRWRLFGRGFNQSAVLAQEIGGITALNTLPDALRRARRTPNLGQLSAAARHRALEGAIVVNPRHTPSLEGRRIVLVDDVMTSGATAAACTTALLDAGAARIDVVVACRVADPRDHA